METIIKYLISRGNDPETAKIIASTFCGEMWSIADDTEIDSDAQYDELMTLCECYGIPEDVMYSAM